MEAIYIYPEDLNYTMYCKEWINFCKKLGYNNDPSCILVCTIKTNQS